MDLGKEVSSNYGIFNPGTLNPHQLAQLLSVLSDESVDNTTLDSLQKKLSRSFIAGDSMKVRNHFTVTRASSFYVCSRCLIIHVFNSFGWEQSHIVAMARFRLTYYDALSKKQGIILLFKYQGRRY